MNNDPKAPQAEDLADDSLDQVTGAGTSDLSTGGEEPIEAGGAGKASLPVLNMVKKVDTTILRFEGTGSDE